MARQREQQPGDPAVAAIERLLEAERDGVQKLQRCESDARQLLGQAREQAAAIARRADARISRLHMAYLQKIEREVREIREAGLPPDKSTDKLCEEAALVAAARRLAAKLTAQE